MAKSKVIYTCSNCGATSPKWIGKCPQCGEWNTYEEEVLVDKKKTNAIVAQAQATEVFSIEEVPLLQEIRLTTVSEEFNRVFGGGIVSGSVNLVAGEPGIGKSTLLLQIALAYEGKILYFSGEESLSQISLRAKRIRQNTNPQCLFSNEKDLSKVLATVKAHNVKLVVIDSIQTISHENSEFLVGSIPQMKEATQAIIDFAKTNNVAFILIGHINKDGQVAGPKVLEHMVDAVFQFEGDKHYFYRLLRPLKNRFGSTNEVAVYEMLDNGLREVINPSEFLVPDHLTESGIAIASVVEGSRSFFIEVQALVTPAVYSAPQRTVTGYDTKRLNMLLSVLEKRLKLRFSSKDVFLNIVGGLRVNDTAIDLAVVVALASSFFDKPIAAENCFMGEVGLAGEIRPVKRIDTRLGDLKKYKFSTVFLPKQLTDDQVKQQNSLFVVKRINEIIKQLFR